VVNNRNRYAISPLFGETAMNLGLATPTEVMDALCFVNEEQSLGRWPGRIGQVLIDRGVLDLDDVTRIMEEVEVRTRTLELPGFTALDLVKRGHTTLQFRGVTIGTRKAVLIRILRFGLADSQEDTERFLSEAKTLSRLNHPNVVKVLSSGELEAIPYLVLENVTGPTLRGQLDKSGPMPEKQALDLLIQVAAGLDHSHSVDVFHGSVRPDAILLPRIGPAKLTDFALFDWGSFAAALGAARLDSPHYLSPEQARKSTRATTASDVYSLGATFFHVLTGRPPFRGAYIEVLRQHMKDPAPDPRTHAPRLSKETARLVEAMLAKDPQDRPHTMADIVSFVRRAPVVNEKSKNAAGLPGRLHPGHSSGPGRR